MLGGSPSLWRWWGAGTDCPNLWMPHPGQCSRPVLMELWANWCSGRCLFPFQEGIRTRWSFKSLSLYNYILPLWEWKKICLHHAFNCYWWVFYVPWLMRNCTYAMPMWKTTRKWLFISATSEFIALLPVMHSPLAERKNQKILIHLERDPEIYSMHTDSCSIPCLLELFQTDSCFQHLSERSSGYVVCLAGFYRDKKILS